MAENKATGGVPAKKGKLKLIVMLVFVVILAIGLSVVGTLWFLGGGIPGLAAGDSEEAAEQADVFVPSTYTTLEKALVTTVQAEGRQRYAQVYLAFEAKDPEALAAASQHMPLLRSRLIGMLGDRDFNNLQTPEGRQALAEDMLTAVNAALEQEGEPPLLRVLFRNFVIQ